MLLLHNHHSWLKMLPYVCPVLGLNKADAAGLPGGRLFLCAKEGRKRGTCDVGFQGFCLAVTRISWAHLPVTKHVALPHRPGSVLPYAGKADCNSWRISLTAAGFTTGSSGNPPSLHLPPLSLLSCPSLPSFLLLTFKKKWLKKTFLGRPQKWETQHSGLLDGYKCWERKVDLLIAL